MSVDAPSTAPEPGAAAQKSSPRPEFRHWLLQTGVSAAIGAVVGMFPTIYITRIQADTQRDQLLLDRRIAALQEYSAACASASRSAFVLGDALFTQGMSVAAPRDPGKGAPAAEAAARDRDLREAQAQQTASQVRHQSARYVVLALFGVDPGFVPAERGPIRTLADYQERLREVQAHCEEVSRKLAVHLQAKK
jgi:hypothetical protein